MPTAHWLAAVMYCKKAGPAGHACPTWPKSSTFPEPQTALCRWLVSADGTIIPPYRDTTVPQFTYLACPHCDALHVRSDDQTSPCLHSTNPPSQPTPYCLRVVQALELFSPSRPLRRLEPPRQPSSTISTKRFPVVREEDTTWLLPATADRPDLSRLCFAPFSAASATIHHTTLLPLPSPRHGVCMTFDRIGISC